MKKIRLIAAAVIGIMVIFSAVLAVKVMIFPPEAEVPDKIDITGNRKFAPGEENEFSLKAVLPLNSKVSAVHINGEGIVPGKMEFEREKWLFDRAVWNIRGKFRALKTGKISGGNVKINTVSFPGGTTQEYYAQIPEFESMIPAELVLGGNLYLSPDLDGELLAEELGESGPVPFYRHWLFWTVVFILLIAAIGIPLWLSAGIKNVKPVSLRERTLMAIRRISDLVKSGRMTPEKAITELSDVIRNYLEERFNIPAARRTTPEFIRDMASDSLLGKEEKLFLTGFMENADMVKFAGASAGGYMVDNAAAEAQMLVEHTAVAEVEK